MKSSVKYKIIIPAIIIVVVPLSIYYVIIPHIRSTKRIKRIQHHHSEMLKVQAGIYKELREYYRKNGYYPENLKLIKDSILDRSFVSPVPEKHKDGHVLNEFKYSTDGNSCTLILEIRGHTYIDKWQKGELVGNELLYK